MQAVSAAAPARHPFKRQRCASIVAQCRLLCVPSRQGDPLEALSRAPLKLVDVTGRGPCAGLAKLKCELPNDPKERAEWWRQAEISAILGSCPKSQAGVVSGAKSWEAFAAVHGNGGKGPWPPTVAALVAWSLTFRCAGTYQNYLGFVRTVCLAKGLEMPEDKQQLVKRAGRALAKRNMFIQRKKMHIQKSMLRNMLLAVDLGAETRSFAMLWLTAYIFLLRLPSEALPMEKGDGYASVDTKSVLHLKDENTVCLTLASRKNRQQCTIIERTCTCEKLPTLCPVHTLWHEFFAEFAVGTKPWGDLSAAAVRKHLRDTLKKLRVPEPESYGTHDFRRGHAKDLQQSGVELVQILAARDWRSPRPMKSAYLDMGCLEKDVVLETALQSDDSDVDWLY